ncbi:CAMK1G [Symbiodinium sp. CCMP2592]|nr:CAMK1G [Symbiodinium sp. CCMP2592]
MSKEAKHPNIAVYLDVLEGAMNFYVIMEELTGAELMDQVEELFPVTEAYLQKVMVEILRALAHLHDVVGLLHRDVKLSNFRFRSKAENAPLALLDFGFAMSLGEAWDGAVCGTLMFMAPEVVGARASAPYLAAMDLWAAGVILYVLLTGDSPANEEEVRRLGRGGSEAGLVLSKALAATELKVASAESLQLLQQLLVLDPSERATAEQALQHPWFSTDGEKHKVNVPSSKYRLARSASRNSEVLTPRAWSQIGEKSTKKLDLPQSFAPLERIVSEGVDEIKD